MASTKDSSKPEHKTKKFGKGERTVPHHTQKAKKFYPAEDEARPKKVRQDLLMSVECCELHHISFDEKSERFFVNGEEAGHARTHLSASLIYYFALHLIVYLNMTKYITTRSGNQKRTLVPDPHLTLVASSSSSLAGSAASASSYSSTFRKVFY